MAVHPTQRRRSGRPARTEGFRTLGAIVPGNLAKLITDPVGKSADFPTLKARALALVEAGLAASPAVNRRLGVIDTGDSVLIAPQVPMSIAARVLEGCNNSTYGSITARMIELYLRGLAVELGIDKLNQLLSGALIQVPDIPLQEELMPLPRTGT